MTTEAETRSPRERRQRVDVNEITFGVEIECYLPHGSIARVGGYHRGIQIDWAPQGWNAQRDGSLDRAPRGYEGVEIVSGILRGADGLREVKFVVEQLRRLDAKVNATCGFHVHVGFPREAKPIERLTYLVANFEDALYAATGTSRRQQQGYSAPITDDLRGLDIRRAVRDSLRRGYARGIDRYRSLNLTNVLAGRRPTVEFRAFQGTLNWQKMAGYIRLCVGLVERALTVKRRTSWDAKPPVATSPIARSGKGATCLTRLFYQLGWTKGRVSHTFGDLTGDDLPTIKQSKRKLMEMARKYDRETRS